MKSIEHWKEKGFSFEKRFPGEYELWVNRITMQRLRRYLDGSEWITREKTGVYHRVEGEGK